MSRRMDVWHSLLLFVNPESKRAHDALRSTYKAPEDLDHEPSWGKANRSVIAQAMTHANPEPQRVVVERPSVVIAAIQPDAPAKTRRPGVEVPHMVRIDTPEGHVDAMANVHSWDL